MKRVVDHKALGGRSIMLGSDLLILLALRFAPTDGRPVILLYDPLKENSEPYWTDLHNLNHAVFAGIA